MNIFSSRSLSTNLILTLVSAQALLILLAMAAFPLLAPYTSYQTIADASVRSLIVQSLTLDSKKELILQPTPSFLEYTARRPKLGWAVVEISSGHEINNSAADLVSIVRRLGPLLPQRYGNLETKRPEVADDIVMVTTEHTEFGDVAVVTAGNVFGWDDIPGFIREFLPALIPMFGPVLFGVIIVIPIVVRWFLNPLRAIITTANAINIRSTDLRLPINGLSTELRMFVETLNEVLNRLDVGFARQRLFTANAAHELRTPIAILQARIDMMPDDDPTRTELRRDVRRLALLVDQLLSVARIEEQKETINEIFDLVALVKEVVADCAPLTFRSDRKISFYSDVQSLIIKGHKAAIVSALSNLIDNAIRVEPIKGTVNINVTPQAEVFIVDHGPGINSKDMPFIFEPFWRKNENYPGTGLGLAIASEVANLHNGYLDVSETPNGGATFRFCLNRSLVVSRQTSAM